MLAEPAGEVAPKALEPNAGVEAVLLPAAAPKLPNVGVLVDGLPNIGVLDDAAEGEPNTGAAPDASEGLLLLAPNVNAEDDDDSVGFGVVAEAAAPAKPNPEMPVVVELPKIPVDVVPVDEFPVPGAVAAAPNVPNVGLSEVDAAGDEAAPKLGITLLADWPLWPKTKLGAADVGAVPVLVVVLVSAGLDDVDTKENADVAVLDIDVVLAAVDPAVAPKLKLGVMEGPAGFWAPPNIGTLDEAAAPAEKLGGLDSATDAAFGVVLAGAAAAAFGDPKANIPLPTIGDGLLSVLFVADDGEPKLKDELAAEDPNVLALAVVVAAPAAANEPKLTVGFFCSVVVSLLLQLVLGFTIGEASVVSAGLPIEKPTVLGATVCLLLEGEPKPNPPVVVVEVTTSDVLEASDRAGLEPKLKPEDPIPVAAALGGSVFSADLGLSVVSEVAADLIPKLKPLPLVGGDALAALVPLPKLNLGLSSELVVFVVDVTEPKVNPVLAVVVDAIPVELAAGGTPKENPVLGASEL